ncbi:MAG: response regulator [Marmoricola sp.]
MIAPRRSTATRVLLVDDHDLIAQSLALALGAEGYDASVADLHDRVRLVEQVRMAPPDLVLLDLDLGPFGDGSTLVQPFREAGARVLVVSASTDVCRTGMALERGAVGVLDKRVAFDELLAGIRAAAWGGVVMDPTIRQRTIATMHAAREGRRRAQAPFESLTERERHVLAALVDGTSVREMALRWFVAEATVRSQVRGVLMKLGVNSQLEAVARARQAGWSDVDAARMPV